MSEQMIKVEDDSHARLDVYLVQHMPEDTSRSFIKKLIDHGHVKLNESIVKAHTKVNEGDVISVVIPDEFLTPEYIEPENIPLNIFYEDESLLIINKPCGMQVHPSQGYTTGTLVNALLYHAINLSDINSDIRPGIVHRLDKGTSGLILIAKDNITHTKLAKQFQIRTVKKQYIALVEGEVEYDEGVIDAPIGRHKLHREKKAVQYDDKAKDAKTRYKVVQRKKVCTLIELFPQTGRTHQLRVHMKHIQHSILGDDKYGKKNTFSRQETSFP